MQKYRVIVIREGRTEDEALFEIAGPASLVQSLVPGVLDAVLRDEAPAAVSVADKVFDAAVTAQAADQAAPGGPVFADAAPVKQTRNRRTKAQKAADDEAQGLGFRDAAHRAEAEAAAKGAEGSAQLADEPVAGYMTPDGPVVETPAAPPAGEVVVGSVPGPIVTEAPAPPAGAAPVAAPWNPFQQQG